MNRQTYSPILELRQYTLHPGQRDTLIELFDREFVETQEAVGIQVIGQFCDLDRPDQFVWLRGFNDMTAREQSLKAFYGGPVWKAHREAANATMIAVDNVLLLRRVHPSSGFSLEKEHRPPLGAQAERDGVIRATIYYFAKPVSFNIIHDFENKIQPVLEAAGTQILAYFVSEDSPNTFPALPVREGEHVFVWFAGFPNEAAYQEYAARLDASKLWKETISRSLKRRLKRRPEVLRLAPTARSWLRGPA